MRRSKLYRYASDAVDHGRQYAFRDRPPKYARSGFISGTFASCRARAAGLTYSRFMEGLQGRENARSTARSWLTSPRKTPPRLRTGKHRQKPR